MKILKNESLKFHTTMGVGGDAKLFAYPEQTEEFLSLLGERYFIIGRGSNLIFDDEGFYGCVISLEKCFDSICFGDGEKESKHVRVGSGVSLMRLIKESERNGLVGIEFLWGIPGSVGGACYTNAGAFGSSFLQHVRELKVKVEDKGEIKTLRGEEIKFADRIGVRSAIVLEAIVELKKGNPKERMMELQRWRQEHQPIKKRTAGCVFRNPRRDFAGRLIEQAGLKGKRMGDAAISEKHANFIVNLGHAKFRDIISLIKLTREKVFERFGVWLELEVEIIGRDGRISDI